MAFGMVVFCCLASYSGVGRGLRASGCTLFFHDHLVVRDVAPCLIDGVCKVELRRIDARLCFCSILLWVEVLLWTLGVSWRTL